MKMNLQTYSITAEGRFAALLGAGQQDSHVYDRALLETENWVAAPTLGAIVPNWLIVVPRHAALNFKIWQRVTGLDPATIVARIAEHLGLRFDQLIWFEHGPRDTGTSVGCGVDYAHLHILFDPAFTFDALLDQVQASAQLVWRSSKPDLAYSELSGQHSYLIVGCGNRVFYAEHVETTGSQFLRRMVAATANLDAYWDYRSHPHHENIALTSAVFKRRACAASLGG